MQQYVAAAGHAGADHGPDARVRRQGRLQRTMNLEFFHNISKTVIKNRVKNLKKHSFEVLRITLNPTQNCTMAKQWKKEQVWPFFGCFTADSQADTGRHQLYNNGSFVLFFTA